VRAYLGSKSSRSSGVGVSRATSCSSRRTTRVPGCGYRKSVSPANQAIRAGRSRIQKTVSIEPVSVQLARLHLSKLAVSSGFSHGASRTRTGDLLGAISMKGFATSFHASRRRLPHHAALRAGPSATGCHCCSRLLDQNLTTTCLPDRDRQVITLRFGLDNGEPKTLEYRPPRGADARARAPALAAVAPAPRVGPRATGRAHRLLQRSRHSRMLRTSSFSRPSLIPANGGGGPSRWGGLPSVHWQLWLVAGNVPQLEPTSAGFGPN
jgi:hypothetical protein